MHRALTAAALVALPITACSLMRLGEFDASPCTQDADCSAATHAIGREPATCLAYFCNTKSGYCEPAVANADERCDGKDNDCDGFIDEDSKSTPVVFSAPNPTLPSRIPVGLTVSHAFGALPARTYVALGPSDVGWAIASGETDPSPHALTYDFAERDAASDRNCPWWQAPKPTAAVCNFSELAMAALPLELVHVSINRRGCSAGQVRIGISQVAEPYTVWLGKSAQSVSQDTSYLDYGVDRDNEANGCTGASRAPEAARGASFPAVAASTGDQGARALALWLATPAFESSAGTEPAEASTCESTSPIPVEALGVFVPPNETGWLNAADSGRPSTLGSTVSRSPPAPIALGENAYLVAFSGTSNDGGTGIVLSSVSFEASLDGSLMHGAAGFIADAAPGRVALSLGRGERGGPSEKPTIGLAWSSGCARNVFVNFAEAPSADARSPGTFGNVVRIPAGNVVRGPELIYAETGFSVASPEGGWFVIWEERQSLGSGEIKVARVARRGPQLLDTRVLAEGALPLWFTHRGAASELVFGTLIERLGNAIKPVFHPGKCLASH